MIEVSTGARRRTARVAPDINVTPLVDVVLVLLIIFMVVAPQMDQDIQVTLPGIFNPDPEVEGARAPLTLSLTREGVLYIESTAYDLDSAVVALQQVKDENPNRRLALRADAAAPYSKVREVFARLREIGFPGTNLVVGHKGGHQPGVPESSAPSASGAAAPAPEVAPDGGAAPAANAAPAGPDAGAPAPGGL